VASLVVFKIIDLLLLCVNSERTIAIGKIEGK
jgi:hypothetical protein